MYERTFGTDWDAIDREEAIRRAYALGVAARFGERHPGELDRLAAAVDTAYDRNFVEIAYQEGRQEAGDRTTSDRGREDVWRELVAGDSEPPDAPGLESEQSDAGGPPEAISRFDVDTRPDDSTAVLDQPGFLTREGAEEPDRDERRKRGRTEESRERSPLTGDSLEGRYRVSEESDGADADEGDEEADDRDGTGTGPDGDR